MSTKGLTVGVWDSPEEVVKGFIFRDFNGLTSEEDWGVSP